jgi:hypothetical protein
MSWFIEIFANALGDILGFLAFEKPNKFDLIGRIVLWIVFALGVGFALGVISWLLGGDILSAFRD